MYSLLLAIQPDVTECVRCTAGPKLLIQARLARLKGDVATAKKDNSLAVKFVRCTQPAGASCRVCSRSSTGAITTGAAALGSPLQHLRWAQSRAGGVSV